MVMKKWWIFIICSFFVMVGVNHILAQEVTKQTEFKAVGPTEPERRPGREVGTIKVTFDLLPTTMSFDMPWTYCMLTENNIKFANFAAEIASVTEPI